MNASFWVAAAFVVFMGVLWYLGAFKTVIAGLDNRAEAIRKELEEAKALREEAQRVFQEYKKKFAASEHEADEIIARAKSEAARYTAEVDAEFQSFMKRRREMAEKRIAQAEANAMAEVRSAAADAAIKASEIILRQTVVGATADKLLEQDLTEVRREFR
ncbi:MAG: ATP F0F1 synthase subunit B [Alphaproteobacteria bacterium]|nr:ATP F0F1 synthase subunit B [Alphaproteobacteria bacterium]